MNNPSSPSSAHHATLMRDLDTLMADVKALLSDTAEDAGKQAGETRAQLKDLLDDLQARLRVLRAQGSSQARHWAEAGEQYVHEHPWRALGAATAVAAACGVLCALACSRRC